MKFIQKLLALVLVFALNFNFATAQEQARRSKDHKSLTPEQRAEKQTQRMTKKLSLDENQVSKIAAINLAYVQGLEAAKTQYSEKSAAKETMIALRSEKESAIESVLNTDQQAKYSEMQSRGHSRKGMKGKKDYKGYKRQNAGKDVSPEKRAQKQTARMTKELGLDKTQTDQISIINLDYVQKINAAKSSATEKVAAKAIIKALKTEQYKAIISVLNEDQQIKYEEMKKRETR